jgi:inhibitor of KinA
VDERINAPRLDVPREKVAQGSVGIGGKQTGIYGRSRPGGWRLIGAVTVIPDIMPGDRIRFVSQ